MHNLYSEHFLQ